MIKIRSFFGSMLLLAGMLVSIAANAQKKEVVYYNKHMQPTAPSDAHYWGLIETHNAKSAAGTITCYTMDSVLVSRKEYSNVGLGKAASVVHGTATYWYSNGHKREETAIVEGFRQGTHQEWYESGNLKYSMTYAKSQLQDTLFGYYESGKLRRKDTYKDGKLLKGMVLAEDGSQLPYVPHFELPQHPGGEDNMMKFLIKTMRYPAEAQRKGISGLVVLKLMVSTDGTFDQIEIVKSVDPHLDQEAIRVVNAMPRWEPGKREGIAEAMEFILPLRFAIR